MQFVIVTSSLGRVHGFIRHGEAFKFDLLLRSLPHVSELWFLTEPRKHGTRPYWTKIWQRRLVSCEIDYDTHEVRDISHF
jgi:hypothetical protein